VDNNSSDGTDEYLRTHPTDVRVIHNKSNIGSTAAKNQAIRAVPADVYVTMDSDVTIQAGTIRRMLGVLRDRPRAGMVSCRFVDAEGKDIQDEQTCFTLRRHLAGLGVADRLRRRRLPAGRPQSDAIVAGEPVRHTDTPFECCLLVRARAIRDVGLLDERFFIAYGSHDWAARMIRQGWQVLECVNVVQVHHKHSTITPQSHLARWNWVDAQQLIRKWGLPGSARAKALVDLLDDLVMSAGIAVKAILGRRAPHRRRHLAHFLVKLAWDARWLVLPGWRPPSLADSGQRSLKEGGEHE
jgi:GT2 family glycosyltransferase